MTLNAELIQHLQQTTGRTLQNPRIASVGGGDINAAYRLRADGVDWFVKLNRASLADMFAAEAAGLRELRESDTVEVPEPICHGRFADQSYLVLHFVELGPLHSTAAGRFGEALAALHRIRQPWFGWHRDNTIGSTPQFNRRADDWVEFWRDRRLGEQLRIAAENGHGGPLQSLGERLRERVGEFFSDYRPHPSLLHGDLWGGNAGCDAQGQPLMYDPACYYGDREADIAMTELFGGFSRDFYAAYQREYPLDSGYKTRVTLYNLYHILNHLNLFGGGYQSQAKRMMEQLLAELG
ncbi:fructosamine kinase family protein [Methylomonas sp. CM2]|uniref:fructosamine kinase family protein n=1 Tax=Methylomonas sp. CM2 TaxID=3417647 RepID=UPI003CE6E201